MRLNGSLYLLRLTPARGQIVLKQLFQATWKTYKTCFDPLIANIHDHGMLVQNQATLAQIEEFRRDRLANSQQNEAHRLREMYTWLRSPDHDQASNAENDQVRACKGPQRLSWRWKLVVEQAGVHRVDGPGLPSHSTSVMDQRGAWGW